MSVLTEDLIRLAFTNEEIILENEIKRKDTIKMRYIPPIPEPMNEPMFNKQFGSNFLKLQDPTDI